MRRPQMLRTHARGSGWYRIENLAGSTGPARVYLYDEIGLWGVTAADFVRELESVHADAIELHINSPGGDVFDGIAIYNSLRAHSATVTTIVDGIAASAASFIAQAGSTVQITRNGVMMIHDAEGLCLGNAEDMTAMAALLEAASDNIADIYAQRGSGTVKQWRKAMRAETWYNNGAEAVAAGLADEIYEPAESPTDRAPVRPQATRPDPKGPPPAPPVPVAPEVTPTAAVVTAEFAFDPDAFRAAMATAADGGVAGFDPDAFRQTMLTLANNAPAIPDLPPPAPDLPPLPAPAPALCGCGRPLDTAHDVTIAGSGLTADGLRQIIRDVADDCPALPDRPVATAAPDSPGPVFDRDAFHRALERGLL